MSLKRTVLYVVAGITLIRLSFWGLIGSCTALAPDEAGYFQVFRWINNSLDTRPQLHWAGTPEWLLHLLFTPAKILTSLGIGEFEAFRLQTILIAASATLLIVLAFVRSELYPRILNLEKKSKTSLVFFLSLALLMPSNLIWTTLGLREPFIYFSLSLLLISFSNFFNSKANLSTWIFPYFAALVILGFTKFYLLIIVLVSIIFTLLILTQKVKVLKVVIVLMVTLAIIPVLSEKINEVNWPTIQVSTINFTLDMLPDFSTPQLPSMTFNQLTECRASETAGPVLLASLRFAELFFQERTQNALTQVPVGEPSATALRSDENLREDLNLVNLPIGLFSFLLFPISILDAGIFGLLGVVELIFWLPLYLLLGRQVVRARRMITTSPLLLVSLSFIVSFTLFSALAEVNFGTALRHRSVLLAPMVLAAVAAWTARPAETNPTPLGKHHPLS